jgi:NAD(P)-dependent dehydrogenase (short-subunit alcohol dehydrogenase family)
MGMIIIIGASGGIGGVLYSELMKDGCTVGTHTGRAERPDLIPLDITNINAVEGFAKTYQNKAITLINCAGYNANGTITKLSNKDWYRVLEVNLIGSYHLLQAFLPIMKEVGWGRVIFLTSVLSKNPVRGTSAYAASKAGLVGLMQTAVKEIRYDEDVTINALRLGYFDTGMIRDVPPELKPSRLCNTTGLIKVIETIVLNRDINGAEIPIEGKQ